MAETLLFRWDLLTYFGRFNAPPMTVKTAKKADRGGIETRMKWGFFTLDLTVMGKCWPHGCRAVSEFLKAVVS
jgi:hypothetical protein